MSFSRYSCFHCVKMSGFNLGLLSGRSKCQGYTRSPAIIRPSSSDTIRTFNIHSLLYRLKKLISTLNFFQVCFRIILFQPLLAFIQNIFRVQFQTGPSYHLILQSSNFYATSKNQSQNKTVFKLLVCK
jgi:hypothetical protein